uniref:AAA+ ATPase domain-containing protein n=1 Tax=Meloidogyne enterolobii TaxID=390850 RepID=A0A6V7VYV5_MELEN|nr:unnamed protein product [Meloidogyne enterolobii]
MNNNKILTRQILPEVEISINLNGITISSDRLTPSRFVAYDIGGKCRECKSTEVELDFVVTKDGITIYCSRISGTRYVSFDSTYELPGICFFRIKNKGRVFNIPYGSVKPQTPLHTQQQIQPATLNNQTTISAKQSKPKQPNNSQKPTKHTHENILNDKNEENKENVLLNEFFDSLDAATTGIQSDKMNNLKKHATEMEEEEMAAIEALYNIPPFTDKDLKFKIPFGMIISGPSSSGKSTLLLKFISEASDLIDPKPKSILYCFGEMSNIVPILQKSGVSVYSGVPPEDLIRKYQKPLLLILDDLLMSIDEKYLSELFTKKSHHQNFAIVFVTQNLFERKIKVARQNAQYIIIMRSPNSVLSVRNIGVQLFPQKLDYFLDAYRQATNKPFGYLVIDMHASSDPGLRLRTILAKTKSQRKLQRMLRLSNTNQLLAITEICLNIIKARLRLTNFQKKRLLPYADFVRKMSRVRSEHGARKILNQKGGGIGTFAALLTPVLIELAKSLGNSIKSDK